MAVCFLGYIIAFLLLHETQTNKNFSPTYSLWIIAIPLFDVISVLIYRYKNSYPLFAPDRNHIHHFLQNLKLSRSVIFFYIMILAGFIFFVGLLIEYNFRVISFPAFLCFLFLYVWFRVFSSFSNRMMINKNKRV